jgi:DNA topoisomerase-1
MDYKLYLSDKGVFKDNNKFYYFKNNKEVTHENTLERIKKIYTPPAWKSVWYASNKNCHIQAHGIDSSGKKQYIFSESWVNNSKYEKYNRMKRFMKDIIKFKRKIKLKENKLISKEILIHLLFNLLIDTHIRVGNEIYAETNGSYGLTTLRQKHLIINGTNFTFSFIGKSNIKHDIDIPTKYNYYLRYFKKNNGNGPLFFYDDKKKVIHSEELNNYLKENMGSEYTCKDFRTYSANILFIKAFLKNAKGNKKSKKIILKSIDNVAEQLGHTRNISRKSYISTNLLDYCYDFFETASSLTPDVLVSKVCD